MNRNLSRTERHLLDIIQTSFPLTARPYQAIGQRLGLSEQEVIATLESLKSRQIIRQISAIFLGNMLGFDTALISFQVPDPAVEQAAETINGHPGVSHNYLRAHALNIWFTLSVPQDLDIQQHVQTLAGLTACVRYLYLPGLTKFKRRVQFPMKAETKQPAATPYSFESSLKKSRKITLSNETQCSIMEALQQDLPLTSTPFLDIARRFKVDEEPFFDFVASLKTTRKMSRFAGILRHRHLGYTANAMVVWNVAKHLVEEFGSYASEKPAVSHCYERVTYPDWQYNMYTMIHGITPKDTNAVIEDILAKFPNTPYEKLYSVREFKKQRVNFFNNAIYEWHRQSASAIVRGGFR
jgi:DNA-binding Lrp family transcriptional regulator